MKFRVIAQNEHDCVVECETITRDGDWVLLNRGVPAMDKRRFPDPESPTGMKEVMVQTGAIVQTPIAIFFRPISVTLIAEQDLKEPTNGE